MGVRDRNSSSGVFQDILQDPIFILKDLDIGISQYFVAHPSKVIVSFNVVPETFNRVVLATIKLNNEPRLGAAEINDVPSERHLTTEFHSELIPSQRCP